VKTIMKRAGRTAAGVLPAALLVQLGLPALAGVIFLAILMMGVICWVIGSDARTDRVTRMMLARRGDARCLKPEPARLLAGRTSVGPVSPRHGKHGTYR
jgi:hypothetical protein